MVKNDYLCSELVHGMLSYCAMVEVYALEYRDKEYLVADIPDVFTDSKGRVLIGSRTLNDAIFNDKKGYPDKTAEMIDEQIYAYLDDSFFSLKEKEFISVAKDLLD